jgi:flagellar biosynthetic protein FliQ
VLLTVLVVGLLVSIFQAATQINEATLSFVPKIVAAVATLAVAGPWMMTTLVEYLQRTLQAIPGAVGAERTGARVRGPGRSMIASLTFTEAQILAWLTPLLWPFLRALALFRALPVLGTRTVPARCASALAMLIIALAAQGSLPPMPAVPLDSPAGLRCWWCSSW